MFSEKRLPEVLRNGALERGKQTLFTFLADGETESARLTWEELDRRARSLALHLEALGARGERAVLLYPPGLDFVAAFFGCLYAGVVAVPAYPPRPARTQPRLRAVVADARPRVALTVAALLTKKEAFTAAVPELAGVSWLATDTLPPGAAEDWRDPGLGPEALAFLQYTSGSTSSPKGVMVTHGNLIHNERMIQAAFGQSAESVIVGWLPLHHDMGLIGNVLQPLWTGARCILMPPVAFLQHPARWLRAISRYRGTTSGGPDFAYELCARRIGAEERDSLDLASWRVAFNGAEPVRAATLERFAATFGPCGFRPEAFYPCYGLAEATLFVAGGEPQSAPAIAAVDPTALERGLAVADDSSCRRLVGCGHAWTGQRLVIADPQRGTRSPAGQVGEIWVEGASVARGYWNRPEETAETFGASLADTGEGPFLRTGDLGFVAGGQLFVTGRMKDLIIIRGRNHYPQDLELTVERSHPAVRLGGVAAFAVEAGGEEQLAVVCEREPHSRAAVEEMAEAVRRAVAEEHQIGVYEVVVIRAGTLPKTSSNKVQRRACRAALLAGELDVLGSDRLAGRAVDAGLLQITPESLLAVEGEDRRTMLAAYVHERAARALRVAPALLAPDRPLSAAGLDSLMAVELKNDLEVGLGVRLGLGDVLQGSVARLCLLVLDQLAGLAPSANTADTADAAAGPTAGDEALDYPLTHGQRSLWFLHRLAPGSAAHNLAFAARLLPPVDRAALARTLQALVARHSSLRTAFAAPGGEPRQRVDPAARLEWREEDAAAWTEAALQARLSAEAERPFDLERAPLLRAVLLRRSEGDVLLVSVHHIAVDFWSFLVLLDEFRLLYAADLEGASPGLPPPQAEYRDYVRWQGEMLAGPRGERLWEYWREQLGGELPQLLLPADRPRGSAPGSRASWHRFALTIELVPRLRQLAEAQGATLYMVLLAAFEVLLHRYTGQEDLLLGSPAACRGEPRFEDLVGYLMNPLPLRADLSGDPSFARLLAQTRRTALGALEHQDYPAHLLAERLRPGRDHGSAPLFRLLFVFNRAQRLAGEAALFALGAPGARMDLGGLGLEAVPLEGGAVEFDLQLNLAEAGGTLFAALQYSRELFDPATIERLAAHWQTLLADLAVRPAERVSALQLLTAGERRQLLGEWAHGGGSGAEIPCVHRQIEEQARRSPHAAAVGFAGGWLTYRELNCRANRLAHRLRALGVGPEVCVALCIERSLDMVVGLLGVLKAGGAYVPLDPASPRERLAFVLEDSRAPVLLTQRRLLDRLPESAARPFLVDGGELGTAGGNGDDGDAGDDGEDLPGGAGPANLAYVIYTSGSTGRPKGVLVQHGSLAAYTAAAAASYGIGPEDRMLQFASISFDASAEEIYPCLTRGAALVLREESMLDSSAGFLRACGDQALTVLNLPTAYWHELAASMEVEPLAVPASARLVIIGGERALPGRLASWRRRANGHVRLVNTYGPTEATIVATAAELGEDADGELPIGQPVGPAWAYLLDRGLELVPAGVPGEIFLGGAGLARGYLERPELTADRFGPDPFGAAAGGRLYRTGDLARRRPDGQLEFLGRVDLQVKIHGFRVELGEIEAALRRHPAVHDAVVVARQASGDPLVAYLVAREEAPPTVGELRAFLKEGLPPYMVPATFVVLPELPLTASGKVDRRRLPDLGIAPLEPGADFVAPRTPEEEVLAGICAEALGRERIGVNDDLFELGCHSLVATRIIAQMREAFGIDVALVRLFEAPTVVGLAASLEEARQAGGELPLPPIVPVPRDGDLPLSFAQERIWFLTRLNPGLVSYHVPRAIRFDGPFSAWMVERSFSEIVRRHEVLRTRFPENDGRPVQRIQPYRPIVIPLIDLGALDADRRQAEVERLILSEGRRPFDLARGPLIRVRMLRLAEQAHVVISTEHHLVHDGWTQTVLVRDFLALYEAFSEGRPSPLPELPIQYADFAVWQRQWLRDEVMERQLDYWQERLLGAPPVLDLPTDRPRPAVQSFQGDQLTLDLPAPVAQALRAFSRRAGSTLFMTMLAVFETLLYRYAGQEDIVVGTGIANRRVAAVEGLLGMIINTLVLRTDLSGRPPFTELVERVRRVCLGAYAHQDLPFEKLVDAVQPQRDLGYMPLFQVLFAFMDAPMPELKLPGLELSVLEAHNRTTKCDLNMTIIPHREQAIGQLAASRSGEITLLFEYSSDLFDRSTVQRMLGHFEILLASAAAEPGRRLGELAMLRPAERHQVLAEWADTAVPAQPLIAAQAECRPEAPAATFEDDLLTSGELDRQSNLAGLLPEAAGRGAGEPVGLGL